MQFFLVCCFKNTTLKVDDILHYEYVFFDDYNLSRLYRF